MFRFPHPAPQTHTHQALRADTAHCASYATPAATLTRPTRCCTASLPLASDTTHTAPSATVQPTRATRVEHHHQPKSVALAPIAASNRLRNKRPKLHRCPDTPAIAHKSASNRSVKQRRHAQKGGHQPPTQRRPRLGATRRRHRVDGSESVVETSRLTGSHR